VNIRGEYTVTVKGCIITASEWLSWREYGLSNAEIAILLGISPSMARIIARKFRQTGVPDLQYRKRKPGPVKIIDTTTDAGAYVLGILWGTASTSGEGYWVRHRDRWYVDVMRVAPGCYGGRIRKLLQNRRPVPVKDNPRGGCNRRESCLGSPWLDPAEIPGETVSLRPSGRSGFCAGVG